MSINLVQMTAEETRRQIATAAMQALASNGALMTAIQEKDRLSPEQFPRLLARIAVQYADALMVELDSGK